MGRKLAFHMKPYPSLPVGRSCEKLVRILFRNRGGNSPSLGYDGYYEYTPSQGKTKWSLRFLCAGICADILSETKGSNSKFSILEPKGLNGSV
ncbi:MAG: hypothetical protein NTX75_15675 [Proteobacteria bacterium]|nr:hypothetical protein [Pseudomonadota bacterium]